MLRVIKGKLTAEEKEKLLAVYEESNRENGGEMFPGDPPELALEKVHAGYGQFLDEFLADPRNACYVWEEGGEYRSALRLMKMPDFYYTEALETTPAHRRQGYGETLIRAMLADLEREGPVTVRNVISKKNEKSLVCHQKCGFVIDQRDGVWYETGDPTPDPKVYGMLYQG